MKRKVSLVLLFLTICMNSMLIASVVEVCCAIKPNSETVATCPCSPSMINPDAKGIIPVVIFTTNSIVDDGCPDFDATQIDPATLYFGPLQAEAVHSKLIDIDNDGDLDMNVKFKTQKTGIKHGDTSVELTGSTLDGTEFYYEGAIRTVPKGKEEAPATFTPYINPDDPLLFTLGSASGYFIEYFGLKDSEGFPITANLIRVEDTTTGDVTTIAIDSEGRPVQMYASNGTVFEIIWQTDTLILITAISPDGSVQVNISIDLTTLATTQIATNSSAISATAKQVVSTEARNGVPTQLSVTPVQSPLNSLFLSATGTSESLINVESCGTAVDNALVLMGIAPASGAAFTVPAQFVGNGTYSATIPTQSSTIGGLTQAICESIAGVLGHVCTGLSLIPPGGKTVICTSIAAAIDLIIGGPTGEGAAILVACQSGFTAALAYCNSVGWSPGPGAPSVADYICENIDDIVDNIVVGNVLLMPSAMIPGIGSASAPSQWASASGPFPNFIIDTGGSLDIVSFTTSPIDPLPYQSYVATAEIRCAPPQTLVTMSISGTDGYFDSQTTTVEGNVSCTLWVPGAYEGVVDTVTVHVGGQSKQTVLVF